MQLAGIYTTVCRGRISHYTTLRVWNPFHVDHGLNFRHHTLTMLAQLGKESLSNFIVLYACHPIHVEASNIIEN